MSLIPMPSPAGTNYAGLYLPAVFPYSEPQMAMDAMPRGMSPRPRGLSPRAQAAAEYGMTFDGPIAPAQARHVLKFLASRLSPKDLAQVEALTRTDEVGTVQSKPTASKPITPMTHGGDPFAPGYGSGKDYGGLRAQAERANAVLNRKQAPGTKEAKDGLIGGVLGAAMGGVAGGPLGALAGGVIGASIDDDQITSNIGKDRRIAMDSKRSPSSSYDAMFPDVAKIALDSWSGTQAPSRRPAMSPRAAASFDEMFPDAKRIGRI